MSVNLPRLPEPGETIAGKYLLLRMLGRGGVGVVFEAEHLKLRQTVAIKVLAAEMIAQPAMVERFEREARAMAMLASPRVTRVTDVDVTPEGIPFLVMEYLKGRDLQSELKERGALPTHEAVSWVREACAGMSVVHAAGVVHRDLKPANLFIVDGPPRSLKIMDFGISKISGDDHEMTMTTTSLGTPAYMSPEQVRSAKHIDVRSDVWSLGVILYRALAGKLPFAGSGSTGMAVAIATEEPAPIEQWRPDLPPGLVAIVRRTLQKDPNARFPTVQALADALAPFEQPTGAPPIVTAPASMPGSEPTLASVSHTSSSSQPRRSRALPIAIGAIAAASALGVAAFFALRSPTEKSPAPAATTTEAPTAPAAKPPVTVEEIEPAPPPKTSSSASATIAAPKPAAPKPPAPRPAEPKPTTTAPKPANTGMPVTL
jgi:serine/threonine-protein kinase